MDSADLDSVAKKAAWLANDEKLSGVVAEGLIREILSPLLAVDGYELETPEERASGFDFHAKRSVSDGTSALIMAIEYKHYRRPLPLEPLRALLGACFFANIDRALLVSRSGFTKQTSESVRRELPVSVQLLDIPRIQAWIERLRSEIAGEPRSRFIEHIRQLSRKLASEIANDPRFLYEVEWRDLERLIAEVFDQFGFVVTLTPSSRDGGKDVIIEGLVRGERESYIVEIKHWRSGKRVGYDDVHEFMSVVLKEGHVGGLFLASEGYSSPVVEALTEISRHHVRLGKDDKIAALCQRYFKTISGIWSPPEQLPELLFETTLGVASN